MQNYKIFCPSGLIIVYRYNFEKLIWTLSTSVILLPFEDNYNYFPDIREVGVGQPFYQSHSLTYIFKLDTYPERCIHQRVKMLWR